MPSGNVNASLEAILGIDRKLKANWSMDTAQDLQWQLDLDLSEPEPNYTSILEVLVGVRADWIDVDKLQVIEDALSKVNVKEDQALFCFVVSRGFAPKSYNIYHDIKPEHKRLTYNVGLAGVPADDTIKHYSAMVEKASKVYQDVFVKLNKQKITVHYRASHTAIRSYVTLN